MTEFKKVEKITELNCYSVLWGVMESASSDQSLTTESSENESDATASSMFVRKQIGIKNSGQVLGPTSKRIRAVFH